MEKVAFDHSPNNGFFKILSHRIDAYFIENKRSKKSNGLYLAKILFYVVVTISLYGAILSKVFGGWALAILFLLFGVSMTILLFTVAHDASHQAISKRPWINRLLSYVWNLGGISSYFWGLKHNIAHHTFTNIPGKDDDIDQSKLLRLNPNAKRRWFHRFQHLYAPFLYALLSINIVYFKDFKLLLQHQFGNKTIDRHPRKEIWILVATKLFFIGYMILIPKFILNLTWLEILGYHLIMHMGIGLFIGFILVPVHVTGESTYRLPDWNGKVHYGWGEHQLEATVDFVANSYLVNWVTGGLNTHVIHHLYPGINHIHYYQLTRIIQETALEFNLPYRNYSLGKIFIEHLRFLKALGEEDNPTQNEQFNLTLS